MQTEFTVTDLAGLNAALSAIGRDAPNPSPGTNYVISITIPDGTLVLDDELLAIHLGEGDSLVLHGNGATLDGQGVQRGLFVYSGQVEIDNLIVAHTRASGGDGGDGKWGGGGGGGLGGGLFVASAGQVTLRDVTFTDNAAEGGRGGNSVAGATGSGGGGGLGGAGGDAVLAYAAGGGGGVGLRADGGTVLSATGNPQGAWGIIPGAGGGGRGITPYGAWPRSQEGGGGGGTYSPSQWMVFGGAGGGVIGIDYVGGGGAPLPNVNSGGFGGGGGGASVVPGSGTGGFGGGGGGNAFGTSLPGFGGGGGGASGGAGGGGLGAGGAIFVQAGGALTLLGGGVSGGSVLAGAGGAGAGDGQQAGSGLFLQGGQTVTLGTEAGATLTIADVIADEAGSLGGTSHGGLVIAAHGRVVLTAVNLYTGGTLLGSHARLELADGGAAGSGAIRLADGVMAELVLDGFAAPSGPLLNLNAGFRLTLRALSSSFAQASFEPGNLLRVTDAAHAITLRLDPSFDLAGVTALLGDDGLGAVTVMLAGLPPATVACFCAGTAIATPNGEMPVECLRPGDAVLTAGGMVRRLRWIGGRRIPAALLEGMAEARPVLIAAGALADGVPRRDLRLSAQHALLVGGALVPAAALVNGVTIRRAPVSAAVHYLHLELDDQALILAEGAAAESFLDMDSRAMFDNAATAPPRARPARALRLPRISGGYRLEAIRTALAVRAGLTPARPEGAVRLWLERHDAAGLAGWALDEAGPTRSVELLLRLAGQPVGWTIANAYRLTSTAPDWPRGAAALPLPCRPVATRLSRPCTAATARAC